MGDEEVRQLSLRPLYAVDAWWNARCVGQRGALDNPPWIELMNERKTRFEFASRETFYRELLDPFRQAGWHTFDTD
jgi:hypothetical protein